MNSFFDYLEDRVREIDSILCIGLDPHPDEIADKSRKGLVDFCKRIIEATLPVAAAYKPNMAFFEALGAEGWLALQETLALIPKDVPVILDAKRGDIASTAQAYARAAFEHLDVDAITLNPLLGRDSITPFLVDGKKGVFLLCKTSNPGADDFQNLLTQYEGRLIPFYEIIALKAQTWNDTNQIGVVIGATQVHALQRIRKLNPSMWFLVPGIGAQGGDLAEALLAGLRADGMGMLLPVSRGISKAVDAKIAAESLCAEINRIRRQSMQTQEKNHHKTAERKRLEAIGDQLLSSGCVKFGNFTLKSGLSSPIYLDLRQLISYPDLMNTVCDAYTDVLKSLSFDRITGLPYAALPLATLISQKGGWPMIYPRKEIKEYGTKATIEGICKAGEKIVIIDDLATTGGSKFEAIDKLREAGLMVKDVVVLIDRQSGAAEALAEQGYQLHAVLQFTDLLQYWQDSGQVPADQIQDVFKFLETH
jgi:uridine monophosphate synthetase